LNCVAESPVAARPWLGVGPVSWLVERLIAPRLSDLPTDLSSAAIAAVIVVCLTGIVMPALIKAFHSWLR